MLFFIINNKKSCICMRSLFCFVDLEDIRSHLCTFVLLMLYVHLFLVNRYSLFFPLFILSLLLPVCNLCMCSLTLFVFVYILIFLCIFGAFAYHFSSCFDLRLCYIIIIIIIIIVVAYFYVVLLIIFGRIFISFFFFLSKR